MTLMSTNNRMVRETVIDPQNGTLYRLLICAVIWTVFTENILNERSLTTPPKKRCMTPLTPFYTKFKDRSNESMVSEFKTVSPWYRIGGGLIW